jgi:AcrR family transcriptional regulator
MRTTRRGLTRDAVVAAAADLADEIGLDQIHLATLAGRLGVRTPSLYNHIAGLDGLRRDLTLLGLRELRRRLATAAIGRSGNAALAAMADAYRVFVRDRPGLATATVPSPRLVAVDDPEVMAVEAETMRILLAALAGYGLTGDDAIHAARVFRAAIHGFATLEASGGFGVPVEIDESFRRLVAMVTSAFGPSR